MRGKNYDVFIALFVTPYVSSAPQCSPDRATGQNRRPRSFTDEGNERSGK